MKLVAFLREGVTSYGIVNGDSLADIGSILRERFSDLQTVIAAGAYDALREAEAKAPVLKLADIQYLPPIAKPAKIFCIGHNYEAHRSEMKRDPTLYPATFLRFADTQIGSGQPVISPHVSTSLDYEGELAVIIGRAGRYIKRADALPHVAGYACYNDVSVRDWQRHTASSPRARTFQPLVHSVRGW